MSRATALKKILRILEQLPTDLERARVGELVADATAIPAEQS